MKVKLAQITQYKRNQMKWIAEMLKLPGYQKEQITSDAEVTIYLVYKGETHDHITLYLDNYFDWKWKQKAL